jgi:hypothetical protein
MSSQLQLQLQSQSPFLLTNAILKKIIECLVCPITNELPTNAVILSNGHTYDHKSIEQYGFTLYNNEDDTNNMYVSSINFNTERLLPYYYINFVANRIIQTIKKVSLIDLDDSANAKICYDTSKEIEDLIECPISRSIVTDPFVFSDSHTYDFVQMIFENKSPKTRELMALDAFSNRVVQEIILIFNIESSLTFQSSDINIINDNDEIGPNSPNYVNLILSATDNEIKIIREKNFHLNVFNNMKLRESFVLTYCNHPYFPTFLMNNATPLNVDLLKYCVSKGYDITKKTIKGSTLYYFVLNSDDNYQHFLDYLSVQPININDINSAGYAALNYLVRHNTNYNIDENLFDSFIKLGADPNAFASIETSILYMLVMTDNLHLLKFFHQRGLKLDIYYDDSDTILHKYLISKNHVNPALFEYLVNNSALQINGQGILPIYYSMYFQKKSIAFFILYNHSPTIDLDTIIYGCNLVELINSGSLDDDDKELIENVIFSLME